jgi:release factor glutamine methyltransferase
MRAAAAVTTLGDRLRSDARRVVATAGGEFEEALRAIHRVVEVRMKLSSAARIARERDPAATFDLAAYEGDVARLAAGEPLAYVLREQPFHDRTFVVTPDVLIPRPDTEVLVACALRRLPVDRAAQVLDLGTGSGCIAITLALERPSVQVTAVDTSPAALGVAMLNAKQLAADHVRFLHSHWFAAVAGERFDLIVANPPYVAAGDPHLAGLEHEPVVALVAGRDGLDDLRHIVAHTPDHLAPGGTLMVEHGHDQRDAVLELFREAGFTDRQGLDDLAGRARVVAGRLAVAVSS